MPQRSSSAALQVLVIEDDQAFATFVGRMLRSTGAFEVTVTTTLSGVAGLLRSGRPDVILLDLNLPDATGLETLARLRRMAGDVPVVVLTGLEEHGLSLRALKAGAQDFVFKRELDAETISRVLQFAVERGRLEAAARAAHEHVALLVSELPVVIWAADRDLIITVSQGRALAALGHQPSALVGTSLLALFPEGSRELSIFRRGLAGESLRYDNLHSGRTFETRLEPYRDTNGEITGIAAVSIDVTERRADEVRLRYSAEQFRALSSRVTSIREEERARLSRDIHDHLGQIVTAIRFELAALGGLQQESEFDRAAADERLQGIVQFVDSAAGEVRRIATELRPRVLDDLGIVAAVEWLTEDLQRRTGVRMTVTAPEALVISGDRATALFRIVQEALTNVIRHAGAARVHVRLRETARRIQLTIDDDGCGMKGEAAANPMSLGLLGMRERAAAFGGSVAIHSDGRGTSVVAEIPRGDE